MKTKTAIALLTGIAIGAAAVVLFENGKLLKSALNIIDNINAEDQQAETNTEKDNE